MARLTRSVKLKPRIKLYMVLNEYKKQEDVAKLLGVTRHSFGNWARGATVPSLYEAFRLARLFNCKVDDLFEVVEEEKGEASI
jgi:DNA-binding XRE family transcriptional regulator